MPDTSNQNQKKSRFVESISSSNSIHDRQNDMNLIYHVNKSIEEKRFCIKASTVNEIRTTFMIKAFTMNEIRTTFMIKTFLCSN